MGAKRAFSYYSQTPPLFTFSTLPLQKFQRNSWNGFQEQGVQGFGSNLE